MPSWDKAGITPFLFYSANQAFEESGQGQSADQKPEGRPLEHGAKSNILKDLFTETGTDRKQGDTWLCRAIPARALQRPVY